MSDITFLDDEGPLPQYPLDPRVQAGFETSWWQDVNNATYRQSIAIGIYGTTSDAVQRALDTAAATGTRLVRADSGRTYSITSPLSIPDDVILDMAGATFSKQFNGDLISFFGKRASILRGVFLGNGATFSGRGIVIDQGDIAGWSSLGHQLVWRCRFENFRDYTIDYPTPNRGTFSQVARCQFLPLPVANGGVGIAIRWPNDVLNLNGNRAVEDCYSGDTLLTIGTTQNGFIRNNTVGVPDAKPSIIFGQCYKMIVENNRLAHGLNLMTIAGEDHTFTGNVISSEVAFDAGCLRVRWPSKSNVFAGFNGTVPFAGNSIETSSSLSYTPVWTSNGVAPDYGNANIRAAYQIAATVRGQIQITFGNTTVFGTGQYSWTVPLIPATLTKRFACDAWVQGFPCTAWVDPFNNRIQLYQPNGTIVTNAAPVALANGHMILMNFEYELG